jgi:glyoxylase-like metal-dependent hydrolase (beta-lactamase superfamily II)
MMKLSVVNTGLFKLDGGAMFGVVPKTMWQKLNPPDADNLCTWTMRCLLVEAGSRKILIDTGMGSKQGERFRSHFHPHGDDDLLASIEQCTITAEEITDVFLTHLHFDHVGGAVSRLADDSLVPTFPNATYWTNQQHYDWAYDPNPRERASFLKENFVPLKEQGRLKMIDVEQGVEFLPGFNVRFGYGHTEAMMMPVIDLPSGGRLIYAADLVPSYGHVGLPYVLSYDVRPLVTMEERAALYEFMQPDDFLFFEHDHQHECATLHRNDRGRVVIKETMTLEERLGRVV